MEEAIEDLSDIKECQGLKEIAIFDNQGRLIQTTQKGQFKVGEELYSRLGGIVDIISQKYDQKCYGVTITLEDSEFFIQIDHEDDTMPTLDEKVIALEYDPDNEIEENDAIDRVVEYLKRSEA